MRVRQRAPTLTTRCCTQREIGPVDVEDEASRCAMHAVDETKKGGTEVMSTVTPDPPETGGVEANRTDKGNPPWNAGNVARKATRRASAGRSVLIRRKPDPVPKKPTREIDSDRTTQKDPKKSERGQPL